MFLFLDRKIFLHNTGKALTGISCVQYIKAFPSTVYKKRIDLKRRPSTVRVRTLYCDVVVLLG